MNMENNKDKRECKIVQDLLPSYIENLTTKETKFILKNTQKNVRVVNKFQKG